MPPKSSKQDKGQQKAKEKAKQKVIEDKTFGLKNKNKSKKVQNYIENLQKSTQGSSKAQRQQNQEQVQKSKKQQDLEKKKELDEMLAMSIKQPKVPVGVDPKSILCELFKHKLCNKGYKCKFSHDLSVGMKAKKVDLYTDRRDANGGEEEDNMEDWDQETLEKVVKEKHAAEKGPKTEIVCKFFLDAVEKKLYGWFWKCPNGQTCIYRHALPPGYVLKSQMSALLEEEKEKQVDVSEQIEEERRTVEAKTPITEAVFKEWHDSKTKEKREKQKKIDEDRRAKGIMNGREIFMMEGFEAMDDTAAADDYAREQNDDELIKKMEKETEQRWAEAQMKATNENTVPVDDRVDDVQPSSSSKVLKQDENVPSSSPHVELTPEQEEELFGDDEMDDEELEEMEQQLQQSRLEEQQQ